LFSEVNHDDDDDHEWWWWYDGDDNVGAIECGWVIEYDCLSYTYDDDSYNNDDEQSYHHSYLLNIIDVSLEDLVGPPTKSGRFSPL
jgi:hypothetical protein